MSLTPKTPIPEGAIRFNTDSSKMEVWNGQKWMIVSVSSPNLDGGARGIVMGGNPGVIIIDFLKFSLIFFSPCNLLIAYLLLIACSIPKEDKCINF